MILADSSVWIHLFRAGDSELETLLEKGRVAMHDFVLGELVCGNLRDRSRTIANLRLLPRIGVATTDETLALIANHRLHGRGLGWTDAHLLAAALLARCEIYTRDRALEKTAQHLAIAHFGRH
jgi:predicted nucleic acid-binding protein